MNNTQIRILKASGDLVPFSIDKVKRSLVRSGADKHTVDEITREIQYQVKEGMSTRHIYQLAYALLRKRKKPAAARYKLKRAIMELGPSGFPFERFMQRVMEFEGYKTKINQIIAGNCVTHEVDIISENDEAVYIVECKFHNMVGLKCDVKIPLYVRSRFLDIEKNMPDKTKPYKAWIVTNTRFSEDAIKYGICMGIKLLAWDLPNGNGLKNMIDDKCLYPVTCLSTITGREKQLLLEKGFVFCSDIEKDPNVLGHIGLKTGRIENVVNEVKALV